MEDILIYNCENDWLCQRSRFDALIKWVYVLKPRMSWTLTAVVELAMRPNPSQVCRTTFERLAECRRPYSRIFDVPRRPIQSP